MRAMRLRTCLFLKLLDRSFHVKVFFWTMVFAVAVLVDGYALITLSGLFGTYLSLAIVATGGLLGVMLVMNALRRVFRSLDRKICDGVYPTSEFSQIVSLFVSGVLLVIPGLGTDTIGIVLFVPPFRQLFGRIVVARNRGSFTTIYEFIKMTLF